MNVQKSQTELLAQFDVAEPRDAASSQVEQARRVGELALRETMTPLLLLDLVSRGDVGLVERALSTITGFDERTVNALLLDRGWIGLRTLFRAARLELRHMSGVHIALMALREAGGSIAPEARALHAERCLSRYLTSSNHLPAEEFSEILGLLEDTPRVVSARV